ncbi:MAG: TrkH family potassium uptake protein [Actinomycetota bacterium]|nr:TrkH family potassium uptake protein [Actinomycetota bacterium]
MLPRVGYILGAVVAASGAAMLTAVVVSLLYGEWGQATGIGAAALITVSAGGLAMWRLQLRGELSVREGFAAVGLAWFAMVLFGALPYLLTGSTTAVSDAVFEAAAGFTTTGASIFPDPSALSHGILFWRALTQWVGGMGVIVLSVAILPLLGVGGMQLVRAESPGPQPDRLTPRFRETAKRLWLIYAGLTALEAALLAVGEMNLFQAVAHALTTMSTGGFGTEAASYAEFSPYTQWVTVVFMVLAGTSFALHYRGLRRPASYLRHPEFRLYLLFLVLAITVVTFRIWEGGPLGETIRTSTFNVTSILTTTGYASADFATWPSGVQILLVGLMFVGGMAGSTAGSVKVYRLAVLTRASVADLRRFLHPRGVFVTRFGEQRVPDAIVQSVQSFFLFYMFLFMTGTLVMGLIESSLAAGLDLVTSASAVASALGNIGPGLGLVGPTANYLLVPAAGKWLLAFLMVVGRLELFPVLLLFTPELWKR